MTLPLANSFSANQLVPEVLHALRSPSGIAPEGQGVRVIWLSAPSGAALSLARHRIEQHTVLWAPPAEPDCSEGHPPVTFVGLGAVRVVRSEGPQRLEQARREIEATYQRLFEGTGAEHSAENLPRFWGGLSFAPGRDGSGCWEGFGEATFVLPRWNYFDTGRKARLALAYDPQKDDPAKLIEEANILGQLLAIGANSPAPSSAPSLVAAPDESTSREQWSQLVESIRDGIRRGLYHKVVAARRVTLRVTPPPDAISVFERLGQLAPGCTRFALRIGERTFLGATPEGLVSRRGRRVTTQAIAGSIAAGSPGAAERLLASSKDRAEHEYVVAALKSVLSSLCQELHVQPEPTVRQLRHVLHLQTPLQGRLARDVHVLDLVERLHPTPAVGGVPTAQALEWIARNECAERGWYASPFGWIDAAGDGELLVALRSALILADRVHLYAGAGIVAGSEAGSEYAETEDKLAGMRAALNVGLPGAGRASP